MSLKFQFEDAPLLQTVNVRERYCILAPHGQPEPTGGMEVVGRLKLVPTCG